jgi:hypothetical protein
MAGRLVRDGGDICFVPRFPFVAGTTYAVAVGGTESAVIVRPRPDTPPTTEGLDIRPNATVVPRNLLRLYVSFSDKMSEGYAADHVRLLDEAGQRVEGALLPSEQELWDGARRRLTVLLDPARIKRGLISHLETGYPLRTGEPFRLVVDEGFRDAGGRPLRVGFERRYEVGADERGRVDPAGWALDVPTASSREPLEVRFGRPLDHGLLARCLQVLDPEGRRIEGAPRVGPEEQSWSLTPVEAWLPGPHQLIVDPALEDLAGNSVSRVFDRDLSRPEDAPREARPVAVAFRPR